MSQYQLPTRRQHPGLTVVVGWNNPMQTFYATVADFRAEAAEDAPSLRLGLTTGEIFNPDRVITAVEPFALIPGDLRAALIADRDTVIPHLEPRPARR